jgi:serine/threonine-protein kinase
MEAELTSRLSHPNIISVDDFGVLDDGRPYMIMDFVEGTCISDVIERHGPMSLPDALPIFMQIASALAHAHNQNIIHRDVKLSNIMLINLPHQRAVVKLVDFGIAKKLQPGDGYKDENCGITEGGQVVGSPLYMSPEQCMGEPLDNRTDVYSLGCVMYYVLTGRPVFTAESVMQLMQLQIARQPKSLRALTPSITEEVERMVLKALAKTPDHRFQSMNQLLEALEKALDHVAPLRIVSDCKAA